MPLGTTLPKPPDCECDYPQQLARTPTGHDEWCPVHKREKREKARREGRRD
jgi:hypothetical protein